MLLISSRIVGYPSTYENEWINEHIDKQIQRPKRVRAIGKIYKQILQLELKYFTKFITARPKSRDCVIMLAGNAIDHWGGHTFLGNKL